MNGCKGGGGGSSPAPAPTGGAVSLFGSIKLAQDGTITLSGSMKINYMTIMVLQEPRYSNR